VGRWACGKWATVALSWPQAPTPGAETPSISFIWLIRINHAEPEMKPLTTGRLSKLARKPSRNRPMASTIRPDISAKAAAIDTYCADPGTAMGLSTEKVTMAVMATGPTACVMLLPTKAYANTGRMLTYNPACGGKPASRA